MFQRWVSIHTPTKGVTVWTLTNSVTLLCFNPHTHEGCDGKRSMSEALSRWFQSTHPRRVWRLVIASSWLSLSFNPHTHEGCDILMVLYSTTILSFNPHTHEGCDASLLNEINLSYVSIHTPTKGVTYCCTPIKSWETGFNPHTHEGCDAHILQARLLIRCFNPHTHEGCDVSFRV